MLSLKNLFLIKESLEFRVDAGLAPSPSIKKRLLALLFLVMITPQIISTD